MTRNRTCIMVALLATAAACAQPAASQPAPTLTQAGLLRRLVDLDRLASPPVGERSLLFSSYDRAAHTVENGRLVNWDANNDRGHFLRRTEDGWDVLAEIDGPGALTRLWCDQPGGALRILVDGAAVMEMPFEALFKGETPPFEAPLTYATREEGGHVSYVPIGFSRACTVLTRGFAGAYQVDALRLRDGAAVQPFSLTFDEAAQRALEDVRRIWDKGLTEQDVIGDRRMMAWARQREQVAPGEALADEFKRPGTLRAMYITVTDPRDPRELYGLRNFLLRIWFDGARSPSVEAPLIDFFGSGYERRPVYSMPMGTMRFLDAPFANSHAQNFLYCYFPMPFAKSMRFELQNLGTRKVSLMFYARVERGAPPPGRLRFHARFRSEPASRSFDYPLLEASGPGRFIGCLINADTPRDEWWGSGDHKFWIDGEAFPSALGTGTADYLGDREPLEEFDRPLHGVTRAGSYGKNSGYRWHVPDAVNFDKSLRVTLENWQRDNAQDVDFSSVAYWYATPGASAPLFRTLEPADLRPSGLRIPGAIEFEDNVTGKDWGNILQQKHGVVELSGERGVVLLDDRDVEVTLATPTSGVYQLKLRTVPGTTFAEIQVLTKDDKPIGTVTYARGRTVYTVAPRVELTAPRTTLKLRCKGKPRLDCWIVRPVE